MTRISGEEMPDLLATCTFSAQHRPGASLLRQLSATDPRNPFATPEYVTAEADSGAEPFVLGLMAHGSLVVGSAAFLRRARLDTSLSIPSAPVAPAHFFHQVGTYFAARGVTRIGVNTYASPAGSHIPVIGTEEERTPRREYIVSLNYSDEELLSRMRTDHRQRVRRAIRSNATLRVGSECVLEAHIQMMNASAGRRRSRGENFNINETVESLRPYLDTGCCEMFQAVVDGEVVSSMMVARAPRGYYLFTSGTHPKGMEIGASHYLISRIMAHGRDAGAEILNLGGAIDPESGLAQYKERFGADWVQLEKADFYIGSAARKAITHSIAAVATRFRRALRKASE
jgi:hypothetical protein